MNFMFFYCLITPVLTRSSTRNRNFESGHTFLFSDLIYVLSFFFFLPLHMLWSVGFHTGLLLCWGVLFSYLRDFIIKGLNYLRCFCVTIDMTTPFYFTFSQCGVFISGGDSASAHWLICTCWITSRNKSNFIMFFFLVKF